MAQFAKLDILNGEDYYENYLSLKETVAINPQFIKFGSESMVMMLNSGSLFVIIVILIISALVYFISHRLCVKLSKFETMRKLGMKLEEVKDFSYTLKALEKTFIESYFDVSLAVNIQNMGFYVYNLEFVEFFDGFGNITNCILQFSFNFMLLSIPPYIFYKITTNFEKIKNKDKEVVAALSNYIDEINTNHYHS